MTVTLMQHDSKETGVTQRRLSVPLDEKQIEALEKVATANRRSMGAQAAFIIENWLKESDRNNKNDLTNKN